PAKAAICTAARSSPPRRKSSPRWCRCWGPIAPASRAIAPRQRLRGLFRKSLHYSPRASSFASTVAFGDARWADMRTSIDAYCSRAGVQRPAYPDVEPLRVKTRTAVDLVREGVGSVIWTTGYRPDYRWIRAPVVDEMGFPVQVDGRANVAGLYFVGVHWLRKLKSAILY